MDHSYTIISSRLEHYVLYETGGPGPRRVHVDSLDDMLSFMAGAVPGTGTYKYVGATYLVQLVRDEVGREIHMVSAQPIAWTPTHYMPNTRPATEQEILDMFDDVRQVERVKKGEVIAVWYPGYTGAGVEMASPNSVFLTATAA